MGKSGIPILGSETISEVAFEWPGVVAWQKSLKMSDELNKNNHVELDVRIRHKLWDLGWGLKSYYIIIILLNKLKKNLGHFWSDLATKSFPPH